MHELETLQKMDPGDRWSMFTREGDQRMKTIAKRARDKLIKLAKKQELIRSSVSKVLTTMLVQWELLSDNPKYGEASDTAVREEIESWHDALWNATCGRGGSDMWDGHRDDAYLLAEKKRKG